MRHINPSEIADGFICRLMPNGKSEEKSAQCKNAPYFSAFAEDRGQNKIFRIFLPIGYLSEFFIEITSQPSLFLTKVTTVFFVIYEKLVSCSKA